MSSQANVEKRASDGRENSAEIFSSRAAGARALRLFIGGWIARCFSWYAY